MSSREEFEKWAQGRGMGLTPVGDFYAEDDTQRAWWMWQARQPEIDALKAEVERLRSLSDKLRKAAEELVKFINGDIREAVELDRLGYDLRAALKEGK